MDQEFAAFLTIEKGNGEIKTRSFILGKKSYIIGRPALNIAPDISIDDNYISRRHAMIDFQNDAFILRDLQSLNGTQLNGERLSPNNDYQLDDNSLIGLAIILDKPHILLRFRDGKATHPVQQENSFLQNQMTWMKIDNKKKEVIVDGQQLSLPLMEYSLLYFLFDNAGKVCSRDEIITAVWNNEDPKGVSNEAIDQLIHRLRKKIESDPSNPTRIVSKKGFGYMLIV